MKRILPVLVLLCLVSSVPCTDARLALMSKGVTASNPDACTTGQTMIGREADGTTDDAGGGYIFTKFPALCTGNLASIKVYTYYSTTTTNCTAGVYSDSSGSPGSALGDTNGVNISPADWSNVTTTFTMDSPLAMTKNTVYHLAINCTNDNTVGFRYATGTTAQVHASFQPGSYTAGTLPAYDAWDSSAREYRIWGVAQ